MHAYIHVHTHAPSYTTVITSTDGTKNYHIMQIKFDVHSLMAVAVSTVREDPTTTAVITGTPDSRELRMELLP